MDKANIAMMKGDLEKAIKNYKKALVLQPHFGTYLNLSNAYKRNGQLE